MTVVNGQASTLTSVVNATGAQGGALNGSSNSGNSSFFDNSGAVGGTFAAVGIVAALILAGIAWLLYRRRKAQRMDADVAMAASAAAATTRTPFDDDDPEMMEDHHNYGAGALGGAAAGSNQRFYPTSQNEYEPSHFSQQTTPGYAGMGAYGPTAAGAASAAGYTDYYGNPTNGSQGHYYDHPSSQPGDYYQGQSQGHDGNFSQGHYNGEDYNNGYGYDSQGQMQQQAMYGYPNGGDGEGMPFAAAGAAGYRRRSGMGSGQEDQLLDSNVFADNSSSPGHDVSPPGGIPANVSDHRLDREGLVRRNSSGSANSLRDDQDYTRKVLALAN